MFGVLRSDLNDWHGTVAPSSEFQRVLEFTQRWLIESRFYHMLGFLFGLGFAVQFTRAERRILERILDIHRIPPATIGGHCDYRPARWVSSSLGEWVSRIPADEEVREQVTWSRQRRLGGSRDGRLCRSDHLRNLADTGGLQLS